MSPKKSTYHGILLLNKAKGITSHDAVDAVRHILVQRSVGHAGTLDPAAEGLLVLMVGQATKTARYLADADKEYIAEVRLGLESATYDSEGVDPDAIPLSVEGISRSKIETTLQTFLGTITQAVPPYAAVHVDGERLYKKSRRGEPVTPPERTIRIDVLELLSYEAGLLQIRVVCGKGTYVRSLAHAIGKSLGCGAYLSSLVRTRCGRFRLEDAHRIDELSAARSLGTLETMLLPVDVALGFTSLTLDRNFCPFVQYGRRPKAGDIASVQGEFKSGDHVLLKDERGSLLAIATATIASGGMTANPNLEILKYDRVLA